MPASSQPWYGRAPAAVFLLVLFPPVGLYLMWRFQGWDSRTKRLVTGGAVLWTAGVIAAIVAVVVVVVGGGGGGEQAAAVNHQEAALRKLEKDSERPLNTYYQNGFPRFVHGSVPVQGSDAVERARNYLETYQDLYLQSDPNLALAVRDTRGPGEDGLEHVAFYQMFRGYPVYAGEIVVSLDGDRVFATVGGLLLSDVVLNTIPSVSPREAEDIARDDVGLPGAPIFGETGLLVFDRSLLEDVPSDPHMAWEVTLSDRDPWRVFVDAHTGEVLFKHSLTVSDKSLDLEDANGANAADTACYWNTTDDDWIGDEDGVDEDYADDPDAVNAWQYYHWTYDFYLNNFGRDSYNDDGGELEVYIHSSTKGGASWVGGPACFDCDLIQFNDGNVAYDVMVHEFNHGVLSYRALSEPEYAYQPGALNESLSDTFAYLADPDCPFAEDAVGGPWRNFCDPPAGGQPADRMSEWIPGEGDNGGVHRNNSILNKAAYLIAEGGTHPDTGVQVDGIGRPALAQLYYAAEALVTSGYQFIDWRNMVVAIAQQWSQNHTHDFTAHTLCQVRNGFYAVEIGWGDYGCDGFEDPPESDEDGDGVGDMMDNCIMTFNPNQADTDGDGTGDACDPDADDDGVPGFARCASDPLWAHNNPSSCLDNCTFVPNPDQKDFDHDGKGDLCDDADGDGVLDHLDNCPNDYNPDQANLDPHLDDDGDACDPDVDGDGLSNDNDNCWYDANPGQENADGDDLGDVCDPCPDVANVILACGFYCIQTLEEEICKWFPVFHDADGDTIPDECDDTFNNIFLEAVAGEMVAAESAGKFLKSDGKLMRVELEVDPSSYFKIPLDPSPAADNDVQPSNGCGPDDPWKREIVHCYRCQDAFPQDELALLVLNDMPSGVRAWVSDEEGRSWDSRYKDDMRVFRFRPQGGRKYFLYLGTGPDFEPGERLAFSAVMTTGPAEEQTGPTPSATPSPTSTPTPSPTPTPTLAPTATPTPTAAPTPKLTATPSPAPTAAPTPLLTASPAPTLTVSPIPTPTPTSTPPPTPTATATPAPTLHEQTLIAIADSWVDGSNPASTSGGSDTKLLVVDYSSPRTARSFLEFDLSSIPSSATVSEATLHLFYDGCDFGPDEVDVGVYEVMGSWTESTLSWNTQPSFVWVAEDVISLGCAGATDAYVQWDITGLAQDWVSGSAPNHGMVVKAIDEFGERGRLLAEFGSRERAISEQPKLVVSYVD